MSDFNSLVSFDEIEGSPDFQGLPISDKIKVIDGWADEVIEAADYRESASVVDFTEKVKKDYKSKEIAATIDSKIDPAITGDARKVEAERIFQESFDEASQRREATNPMSYGGTVSPGTGSAYYPKNQKHPEVSGLMDGLLFDNKTRTATPPVDLDLGDGVKIKVGRIANPGRDLFEFTLPDGTRAVEENADVTEAAKAAVSKNLKVFPDTGGDILARFTQGAVEDGILNSIEGGAAIAGMGAAKLALLPIALGTRMEARAGGGFPEKMAPLVEADKKLQAEIVERTRLDTLNGVLDAIAPVNPKEAAESFTGQNNEVLRQLPRAIGQGVGNVALGAASGPAAPATLFAANAAAMGNQSAEDAVNSGRPEVAATAFLQNAIVGGTIETATDLFFTKAFSAAFGKSLSAARPGAESILAKRFKEGVILASQGSAAEAGAETLQGMVANDIARRYYDENREIFAGTADAAAIGALTGLILGGAPSGVATAKEAVKLAFNRSNSTQNENQNDLTFTLGAQASATQSPTEPSNQPAEISKLEEFSNPNEFYRVVVGDEAFQDIVDTGTVRAKPTIEQAPTPGQISLRARPTAFPSFSQGEVLSGYAESNPNHFVIATSDPSIKPSESGRHGKGKTMFPTDQDGNPMSSLDASKVRVYRHLGDGKYQLVYQNGKRINEASAITQAPEVDDAPVRSVIEEFSDEADPTEIPATDVPSVAPLPESPLPVIESESTMAETPTATEVNTPAPVEAPAVVDEAAPETVDFGEPEVMKTFDIDEGLRVEVILNPDGTATVEKTNTETGVTIPLEGAAAPFENPKAALDFLSSTFTRNRDGDIVTEAAAKEPGILERGEQDPLMIFLQTEKMQPKQTDIRKIGRISQRERKGLRGLEEDTSSQASYENAPLLRDYQDNPAAQERLRGIYSRESGNRPDQIADRAYQQGWISAPTAEALYQGIRERLDGDGGLVSQRRESDAEIADMVAERASQVENDFETFYRAIKSPYRRGGVLPARQFLPGDVLQVGTDTVEVTEATEDRVTVRSREGGIFELNADETIGFDSMEENGVPASERETIPQEDRVSREDAVALTSFLREKLGDPTVTAVPSREHSAVAKNGRELEAARRLARLFGRRVVGVQNFPANGAVSRSDNANIFIATDSSRTELLIVAHELLHQMRQTDADLYQDLLDTLDADLAAYVAEKRGEHSDKSLDALQEEFLADYLSDKSADPAFWELLAMRDPSLFERFVDFIRQFLRDVRDKIQSQRVGVERYLRDAAAMQRTLEDVLVAFRARQAQDRAGILDVPLDESMPFADQRFTASDSAYLSAVESGDMETAQRMVDEAARAAGYDVKGFHRTPGKFSKFIPGGPNAESTTYYLSGGGKITFTGQSGKAMWFSPDPENTPANHNVRQGTGNLIAAWLKIKSPLEIDDTTREWAQEVYGNGSREFPLLLADEQISEIQSDQYDGIKLWKKGVDSVENDPKEIIVFNPNQIKSADPVTYDESGQVIPLSQRFNPARDDIRFADRKTKPNQQVFGQDVGREDEIQSKEEVQSAVKGGYFDGDSAVSYWSKEAAFATLGDIEAGRIEPTADTGLDGANQALVTELWKFANAMLREEGDASLLNRMRGRVNDYWNREATRAARALNARGWAQSPMEGTLGKVEEGKREAVEKIEPGTQAVEMVEQIQRDVDASQEKVEDFSQAEIASVAAEVKGKRQTTAPGAPVTAGELALNAGRKVGRRLRAVAAKLDALLSADNDVLFSDPRATPEGKRSLIEKLILNQASTGRRKRGAFIRVAVELGLTEEVAANRFDRIAEIRAEAKTAREADAKEAREGKAEPSAEDKFLAALDEEASRLDKLNDKAKKISDRLQSGPKKRKPVDPAKRQPLDRLVFTALETVATRESIIKDGIRLGLTQEAAARLADAIAVESQARAGRRKKGEKKSIDARASEIANRFENPQDRPVREKNELRAIINETLRRDSTVSEKAFLDRMKAMGASAKDSADLWAAVSNERARRQELRDLRRKAKEEEAKDEEAMNLIRKLAKSQSDTQDNRPGQTPEQSVVMELYRDAIGYGPLRSRVGFVRELEAEGVTQDVANRLFDLALRERQNRTVFGKDRDANRVFGRPNLPATDKSVPFIMREILSHPSIKLVGPEERLRMMSALFQERAGLSPIDARAAAAKFDAILVKKWEEAALRLAEETATKKNAPWFRRKEAIGSEDLITLLDESVKAGTATADIEAVRALYQSFEGSSFSREKMTADLVRAGVPANLAGRMADLAISSKRAKKTTFDRLREAIRAGAMDPRKRLLDEVAKSNGWMDLTDTELQRLAELDAALADPNVTPFEDIRYKREMSRIINSSALPAPLSRSIREYYLASIFSGVKTWVLQTSVVFNAMANLGVRDPLVALASAARGDRAPLAGFVAATGNLGRYVRNAITDGSLALLTGDIRGIQEAEILAAVSGLEQIHDRNMVILRDPRSTLAQKTAAATKVFFAANRLFFRILSGLDNTFQGFIRTYTAELEAFSKAADLGIPRGKMREMTAEVLALTEAFAEEAESKGFGNIKILGRETSIPSPDKQAFVNDRISMAIFAALEGQGVNLDGIRERSFREAAIETGVADFQTGTLPFGRLAKHLQKWSNEGGIISTLLVPVVRTPYQVLHRSAWWSPYGLARIINTGVKTGGFRDFSKSPYESALADPVQLLRRSAETALGTAAFIALGVLMARNEDEPEEEKDFRINLSGPTTANRTQYTAWRQSGRRPFTMQFKVGDRWITLGFRKGGMEFFNFAATILGAWDQRKYNADSNSGSDLMNYTSTLGKELTGEALFFLRGFSSRYALMSEETIANQIGFMLSGFVPAASLLKTPTRLRDMQERETGAMAAFLSQMPVVPMMSPDMPMLNSLGDPLGANEKERSYVQSQFGMPVGWVPFKKRASNSTEAQDEDLYMLLFDKDYFPDVKSRKDFGDDVTLDQYRKFVTMRGQAIKSYLRANYVEFSTMDPEKFKDFVSNKSTEITKRVQKTLRIQ